MAKHKPRDISPEPEGKLNADIQTRIGLELRSTYEDLVRQGVPDKFADLIRKMDGDPEPSDKETK